MVTPTPNFPRDRTRHLLVARLRGRGAAHQNGQPELFREAGEGPRVALRRVLRTLGRSLRHPCSLLHHHGVLGPHFHPSGR